jgi:hypothetical protein
MKNNRRSYVVFALVAFVLAAVVVAKVGALAGQVDTNIERRIVGAELLE